MHTFKKSKAPKPGVSRVKRIDVVNAASLPSAFRASSTNLDIQYARSSTCILQQQCTDRRVTSRFNRRCSRSSPSHSIRGCRNRRFELLQVPRSCRRIEICARLSLLPPSLPPSFPSPPPFQNGCAESQCSGSES